MLYLQGQDATDSHAFTSADWLGLNLEIRVGPKWLEFTERRMGNDFARYASQQKVAAQVVQESAEVIRLDV
jgi:hypothetical protein